MATHNLTISHWSRGQERRGQEEQLLSRQPQHLQDLCGQYWRLQWRFFLLNCLCVLFWCGAENFSACLSQWSFPYTPGTKRDVCHVLLIGEQQDRLPLQRILHIRYKGSPFCSKAWIGLIQIFILRLVNITFQCNWFLNFPSRYSNFEKHEAKWIEIMLVCKMNWSIIWSSHQI